MGGLGYLKGGIGFVLGGRQLALGYSGEGNNLVED
jgi:hypothetical protein